ncbi:unnamed protein product, partial [marine sediment metagenome]
TDVNKVDPSDTSNFIKTTHYTYDDSVDSNFPSSPNSVTDAAGFKQRFEYDKNGNQVKSWYYWEDPNDAGRSCTVTTITEYDDAGRAIETIREVNAVSGNVNASVVILSSTWYNEIGKVEMVEGQHLSGEEGTLSVYEYDQLGNLVETRTYAQASDYDVNDPYANVLTISETLYDAAGRVLVSVAAHDPCEPANGTENVYDALGRVIVTRRWADVDVNLVDLVVDGNVVGRKVADDADLNNAWDGQGSPPGGLNFGWTVDGGNLP